MRVQAINKEHLDMYWDDIKDMLEAGLMYTDGEMNIHQLRMMIVQGTAHVVIIMDDEDVVQGSLAFQLVAYPNVRVVQITARGGYDIFSSEEDFKQLVAGLRKTGATRIECLCDQKQADQLVQKNKFDIKYQMVSLKI
jgi:hypothetical protein